MFSRLQTASLNLVEVLGGTSTFYIPNFQRQYSWTTDNAGLLLEDLLEASGAVDTEATQSDYFLGPILLLEPNGAETSAPKNGADKTEQRGILDGQQRLLTLTTLAAVLRDLDETQERAISGALNNLIWDPAADLISEPIDVIRPRISLPSRFAKFFRRYVLEQGACTKAVPEQIEDLAADEDTLLKVRDRFLHELRDLTQAERDTLAHYLCEKCHFLIAGTQDEARAHIIFKRMNERGKALESYDLLKADVVGQASAVETEDVNTSWRHAQETLGPEFGDLFSHLRVIHDTTRGRALSAIRAIVHKVGGATPFVREELEPFAEIYQQIRLGQVDDGEFAPRIRRHLVSLGRLNGDEWMPAALLALKPGAYTEDEAHSLIQMIERYAYVLRLQMLVVHKRRRRFADIARAVRVGQALTDPENTFPLTREETRVIFYNLRELHVRNQKNCKAVLLRLNDYVAGNPVVVSPSKFSVEHVLPRRTKAAGQWRKSFPNAELRAELTQCLGNLALVSDKQNQQLANKEYGEKFSILKQADERGELQPLTHDILQATTWNGDEIKAREARMLKAIEEIWKISSNGMPKT